MTEPTKRANADDKISSEDYESLLDRYQFSAKELTPGSVLKGKVIKTTPTHVFVDIGFKTEGVIPAEDFPDPSVMKALKPGMEVEALLEKTDLKDGYLVLSKKHADAVRALDALDRAFHGRTPISGRITEKTKGGFNVDVGLPAFLPESHADTRQVKDPDALVGQTFKFRVIKFDRKSRNVVLSRKLLLQEEREKKKRKVFGSIAKDQRLKGTVKSLTSFGAFVDIGGVEGLLHVTDMSWGKVGHPSELLKPSQEIEVVVLDFNEKEGKVSLGLKQLSPDPWESAAQKYPAGTRVKGKVSSLVDFGAFVELEKGIEGLVHVSDLTWSRKTVHPKKMLAVGQEVEVVVLDVNTESRRMSLGLKQTSPHPLEVFRQNHGIGTRVKGKVTSITDFGAFIEVGPGLEGLVHVSDLSWGKVKHPSEMLAMGQEVEAVVLNVDVEKQKISLGLKQLEGDIWEDFCNRQKPGDILKVKVVRITDFGVFVEIMPGIEGVVFASELDEEKVEKPSDVFKVGDERPAKILRLNAKAKKISLSFRQAQHDLQKQELQRYMGGQSDRTTFGDLFKDQLQKFNAPKKGGGKEKANDKG
jgi:small subunit ribosomal protein S1